MERIKTAARREDVIGYPTALLGRIKLSDLRQREIELSEFDLQLSKDAQIMRIATLVAALQDEKAHAYHEAGHAVAAVALGMRIKNVSLGLKEYEDGSGSFGRITHLDRNEIPLKDAFASDWRDNVRMSLGGPAAERLYFQTYHPGVPICDGGGTDRQQVRKHFLLHPNEYFTVGQANDEAEMLVVALWPKIEAVAKALLRRNGCQKKRSEKSTAPLPAAALVAS
jgi:hypothetical protein